MYVSTTGAYVRTQSVEDSRPGSVFFFFFSTNLYVSCEFDRGVVDTYGGSYHTQYRFDTAVLSISVKNVMYVHTKAVSCQLRLYLSSADCVVDSQLFCLQAA